MLSTLWSAIKSLFGYPSDSGPAGGVHTDDLGTGEDGV